MHNEPAYSKLIYEYFVLRFQFQYYKYGDKAPSNRNVMPQIRCIAPNSQKRPSRVCKKKVMCLSNMANAPK